MYEVINDTSIVPTHKQLDRLKEQSMYLRLAYQYAIDNMYDEKTNWTWRACCTESVSEINDKTGLNRISDGNTVMRWNRVY